MRYSHQKYTWERPFGSVRHMWQLVGPKGGIHFTANLSEKWEPSCGLECHRCRRPEARSFGGLNHGRTYLNRKPWWHLQPWQGVLHPHDAEKASAAMAEAREAIAGASLAGDRITDLRIALNDIIALDHHWHGPEGRATEIARAALLRDDDMAAR